MQIHFSSRVLKTYIFFLRFQKQTRPHAAYLIIAYDVAVINLDIQI